MGGLYFFPEAEMCLTGGDDRVCSLNHVHHHIISHTYIYIII